MLTEMVKMITEEGIFQILISESIGLVFSYFLFDYLFKKYKTGKLDNVLRTKLNISIHNTELEHSLMNEFFFLCLGSCDKSLYNKYLNKKNDYLKEYSSLKEFVHFGDDLLSTNFKVSFITLDIYHRLNMHVVENNEKYWAVEKDVFFSKVDSSLVDEIEEIDKAYWKEISHLFKDVQKEFDYGSYPQERMKEFDVLRARWK